MGSGASAQAAKYDAEPDRLAQRPINISSDEQIRYETNGGVKIEKGPKAVYLPTWTPPVKVEIQEIVRLDAKQYAVVRTTTSGASKLRVTHGECRFFLKENEELVLKGEAVNLSPTEYCYVTRQDGTEVLYKGPNQIIPDPYDTVGAKQTAITLENNMYVKVKSKPTGEVFVMRGPCLVFPEPTQEIVDGEPSKAIEVDGETNLIVRDLRTGAQSQVQENGLFFPSAHQVVDQVQRTANMIKLSADDYAIIRDTQKHTLRTEQGEKRFFLQLHEELVRRGNVVRLGTTEYTYIDNDIGEKRIVKGPVRYAPGPHETASSPATAITLEHNGYIKIQDKVSGEVRVERGPKLVYIEPMEQIVGGSAQKAHQVDSETAVLVRDTHLGQISLVQTHGLYFPRAQDDIISVQKLIRLADHEAIVVKAESGAFKFFYGSDQLRGDQPRAFFLPPYNEIVTHCWSKGRRRDKRDLNLTHLDMRPQFMNFEFNSRTSDNVELILEGTFYWQLEDVPKMMTFSGDVPGDICNYARSAFIQKISRVTLKDFMDDFRKIAQQVIEEDTGFYSSRGLKVHSLEVTGYRCAEKATANILQQMIQETTNRMNRTSQQESETELKLTGIHGEIEQERIRGELLAIQQQHLQQEASGAGSSEAEKAAQFLRALEGVVPDPKERVNMWKILRKGDALESLSQGKAHIYFTPNDVNLSIEDKNL